MGCRIIYCYDMVRNRISVIVCSVGALWLVGCSSDKATPSTAGIPSTTRAVGVTPPGATTTTSAAPVGGGTTAVTTVTTATVQPGTATTAKPTATTAKPTATTTKPTTTTTKPTTTTTKPRVVDNPSDNVRLGDSGKGVEQIQTALNAKGFKIGVDGKFGPATDQAVRAFQKKNALKQDGIVGPITWAKLQSTSATPTSVAATTTTKP